MAKELTRRVSIYIDGRKCEQSIKSIEGEISRLTKIQKNATIGSEEYIQATERIKQLRGILNEQRKLTKGLGDAAQSASGKMKSLTEQAAEHSNILMGVQSAAQMAGAAYRKLAGYVEQAAAMDDAMAQVEKRTGMSRDEVEKLNDAFKRMDTRTTREELNKMAYDAGKFGLSTAESVESFVRAADKIKLAVGDELQDIEAFGKTVQLYSDTTDALRNADLGKQMEIVGSAIKALNTNAGNMQDFLLQLGATATTAGLGADQVLGYAAALDNVGINSGRGAKALQQVLSKMGAKTEEFAAVAGLSVKEFSDLMANDMNAALLKVLQGLNQAGGMDRLSPVLKELGAQGAGVSNVLLTLARDIDGITDAQRTAAAELQTATALTDEYNRQNETQAARLEKAKKEFGEAAITLGNAVYPAFIAVTDAAGGVMKGVSGVIGFFKEYPAVLAPAAAALAAFARYKIAARLASVDFMAALKKVTGVQAIQTMRTNAQAAAAARLKAQEEAAKLQYVKNQLAIEQDIILRHKHARTTEEQRLVEYAAVKAGKLNNEVRKQAAAAEAAHKAAIDATKKSMMSMPWGLVLTAVTAIVAGVSKLVSKAREARKATAEMHAGLASAAAQSQREVDKLFEPLRNATAGTTEYKTALEKLKEVYPEIIKSHIDDRGNLRDLEAAYNDVAAAARHSAMEQYKTSKGQEFLDEKMKATSERAEKIKKYLKRGYSESWLYGALAEGEATGDYSRVRKGFRSNGLDRGSAQYQLNEYIDAVEKYNGQMARLDAQIDALAKSTRKPNVPTLLNGAGLPGGGSGGYSNTSGSSNTSNTSSTSNTKPTGKGKADKEKTEREKLHKKIEDEYKKHLEELARLGKELNPEAEAATELEKAYRRMRDGLEKIDSEIAEMEAADRKGATPEQLKRLDELIAKYRELRQRFVETSEAAMQNAQLADESTAQQERFAKAWDAVADAIEAAGDEADKFFENLEAKKKAAQDLKEALKDFAQNASGIAQNISDVFTNVGQGELNEMKERQDEEEKILDEQLAKKLITEEQYNERKSKLQEEYDAREKELKLQQFRREKAIKIAEATITTALNVVKALGEGDPYTKALRAAMYGAMGAAQIAAIASEPEPYARGGYITSPTLALAGERGSEWVASHGLLANAQTGPVIAALDRYQHGGRLELPGDSRQTAILSDLAGYLKDPRNRQAVISRRHMSDTDGRENFLRQQAAF